MKNAHVQSIAASIKLRRPLVRCRARRFLDRSRTHVLDCGAGVRLQGEYTAHGGRGRNIVVLIHGWEGSSDSVYMISAASRLFDRGLDIFRLNLRDHGPTHHLNPGLFHSCRIDEVVGAVAAVQENFPHRRLFLGGFSLGGNFALRTAARAPGAGISLHRVVAVSPVLNPVRTMAVLEFGPRIYHDYFMRKWRRSLQIKHRYFPESEGLDNLFRLKTLGEMTAYFAPRHTGYPNARSYLNGYSLLGDTLRTLEVCCHIIASDDDPVIPAVDLLRLPASDRLVIERTPRGGHCGFFEGLNLESWAVTRMADIFEGPERAPCR
ncbi:YheT family hydrolase [Desulfococcus sp.]|uniref:YheT family hydrolase n=1 Tax=Desulfococcus sp. TaxID=2025834 RepID=UPI0035941152